MKEKDLYKPVAEAVRIEFKQKSDEVYLVFKIIDSAFKKKIKKDWVEDIDLKIINKSLYEFEEND